MPFYCIIIHYNVFDEGLFVFGLMWMPACAALLTKIIIDHSIKGIGWRLCRIKYLIISYFMPIIACIIVYGFVWITGLGQFKPNMPFKHLIIFSIIGVFIGSLSAIGEEIGWRGFLLTELRKSFSYPQICLISGIIWFVYHAPLMWFSTYNNGNILASTVCFFFAVMGMASIANYMCLNTNSFWPGVILHASHNLFVQNVFDPSTINGPFTKYITTEFAIGLALVYCIIAIFLIKKHKKIA